MAYRDFTLEQVLDRFGLDLTTADLFGSVPAAPVRAEFADTLAFGLPVARGVATEKAKSEYIIAPLLLEAARRAATRFGIFPGVQFNVAPDEGLTGYCDFLVSRDPTPFVLRAPLLAVVEAKNDILRDGYGQCAAEMIAAQRFNTAAPAPETGPVYGAVTSGSAWQFLRLDGTTLTLDPDEVYISDPGKIIAILLAIVGGTAAPAGRA